MGCGDWNDGMNLVGIHGKGESVWLGFFLFEVLREFSGSGGRPRRPGVRRSLRLETERLSENIDDHAWDDGGIAGRIRRRFAAGIDVNAECQIDSIAQSWSVLSGAGDPHPCTDRDG